MSRSRWVGFAAGLGLFVLGGMAGWLTAYYGGEKAFGHLSDREMGVRRVSDSLRRRIAVLEDSLAAGVRPPRRQGRFAVRLGYLPRPSAAWQEVSGGIDSVSGFYFYTLGRFSDSMAAIRFRDWIRQRAVRIPLVVNTQP